MSLAFLFYVQGYNYCLSFQLPVSATEDKRSNVNFPSGFGYSIGLCFSLDVNVSLSVCPCFRVHGSIPRPRTQNRPKKLAFKFHFDGCKAVDINMFSDAAQFTVSFKCHTCICHSSKQPVIVECWLNITHSSQFFPHRAIFQLVCVRDRINY